MKLTIPKKREEPRVFELNDAPIAGLSIDKVRAEYFALKGVVAADWNEQVLSRINRRIRECKDRFADEYIKRYKNES